MQPGSRGWRVLSRAESGLIRQAHDHRSRKGPPSINRRITVRILVYAHAIYLPLVLRNG